MEREPGHPRDTRSRCRRGVSKEYRVTWAIDVHATSPLDAAQQARRIQVAPHTTAKVFDVGPRDPAFRSERIDLCTRDLNTVEPADLLLAIVEAFPGLLDGETDVCGADLVACLTDRLRGTPHLEDFVREIASRRHP